MSAIPPQSPPPPDKTPLNPSLKRVVDPTYGPDQTGTDPMKSVSVDEGDGRAWPLIWAAAAVICVIIAIVLIV
jgi:hypothetical protein